MFYGTPCTQSSKYNHIKNERKQREYQLFIEQENVRIYHCPRRLSTFLVMDKIHYMTRLIHIIMTRFIYIYSIALEI